MTLTWITYKGWKQEAEIVHIDHRIILHLALPARKGWSTQNQ